MHRVFQDKTALAISLGIVILIILGVWFWGVLVEYIDPKPGNKGITNRKDVVQAFALIAAGVVGLIGGIVGIANLSVSRRNLEQQIVLEDKRTQEAALQAFFEQMGGLLTEQDLINTDREDVRQLAQAQSHTVLARLDGPRKGALLRFLHVAGLISTDNTIVELTNANLKNADLKNADLIGVNLTRAKLSGAKLNEANLRDARFVFAHLEGAEAVEADLRGAKLISADLTRAKLGGAKLGGTDLKNAKLISADLTCAKLSGAKLSGTDLKNADLTRADLSGAQGVTNEELAQQASSLEGATMPNFKKYED